MSGRGYVLTDDRGSFGQRFIDETHLTGDYVVHTTQDVEPILKAAERMRDDPVSRELKLAGYIPDIFMDTIMREARKYAKRLDGTIDGAAQEEFTSLAVREFLNNSENAKFRVWRGRL